jgi:hypothetical protein
MFFCNIASAQANGTVVATVNVSNAKIITQKDRDFVISFDISNMIGAQPKVKYSVRLTKPSTTTELTVDEKVYDEVLSLSENSSINKTIDYKIPASISAGKYRLWVDSKNSSGLPLGVAFVGEVGVVENVENTIEIIPNSCFFFSSSGKSALKQGNIINPSDTLTAKCKVKSTFPTDVILTPNFITRNHTAFGDIASTTGGSSENLVIKKGINDVTFALPVALKPQDYNLTFNLVSNGVTSNSITFDYTLSGQSGTIKNVVFDKTYYKAGETAYLQIFSTQTSTSTVSVLVLDGNGVPCTATTSQEISNFSVLVLPILITKDCLNPKADIFLSSGGKVLDSNNFRIMTVVSTTTAMATTNKTAIVSILIVIVFIFAVLFYKDKHSIAKVFIFVLLFSFMFSGVSKAVTPSGLSVSSCPAPGTSATISWTSNPTPSIGIYDFDVTDLTTGKDLYCPNGPSSWCWSVPTNIYSVPLSTTPSHTYSWWIREVINDGKHSTAFGTKVSGPNFTCASCTTWAQPSCVGGTIVSPIVNGCPTQPQCVMPPVVSLTPAANPVQYNASTNISGTASNSSSCTMTGNGSTSVWSNPSTINTSSGSITSNTTFSLACSGTGGSATSYATISVIPVITITSDSNPVPYNGSATISWSSTGADSCTVTKNGILWSTSTISGSQSILNLTATTTFVAVCKNNLNTATSSLSVVALPVVPIVITMGVNPSAILSGSSTTVSWNAPLANSCIIKANGVLFEDTTIPDGCTNLGGVWNATSSICNVNGMAQDVCTGLSGSYSTNCSSGSTGKITKVRVGCVATTQNCAIPFNNTSSQTSGSRSSGALTNSTIFIASCVNNSTSATTSAATSPIVMVSPPISLVLSANPTSLSKSGTTNITWNSTGGYNTDLKGADSCSLFVNGQLWKNQELYAGNYCGTTTVETIPSYNYYLNYPYPSGSGGASVICGIPLSTIPSDSFTLNKTTTFTEVCKNNYYSVSTSTTVTLGTTPITIDYLNAASSPVSVGSSTIISWSAKGADSCALTKDNDLSWATTSTGIKQYVPDPTFGVSGSNDGQFKTPYNVVPDPFGNVYVVDSGNNRIQKLDSSGQLILKFGSAGTSNGQFNNPRGLALDSSGNVYVVDRGNNRVQKFDSSGNFIWWLGYDGSTGGTHNTGIGLSASGAGKFTDPFNVSVTDNNITVFDNAAPNHSETFALDGTYVSQSYPGAGVSCWGAQCYTWSVYDSLGNRYDVLSGTSINKYFYVPIISGSKSSGGLSTTTTFFVNCTNSSGIKANAYTTVAVTAPIVTDQPGNGAKVKDGDCFLDKVSGTSSCAIIWNDTCTLIDDFKTGGSDLSCNPTTPDLNVASTTFIIPVANISTCAVSPQPSYAGQNTMWSIVNKDILGGVRWNGTNIAPVTTPALTLSKTYSTVGKKIITAAAIATYPNSTSTYITACSTSTIMNYTDINQNQ